MLDSPSWPTTAYSFAEAVAHDAFDQLELLPGSQFARLGDDRGVKHLRRETLEWLDKQGALRPIGFQINSEAPALHSKRFRRWDRYARDLWGRPHVDALYSRWQLLYVNAAVNGRYVDVDVAALLDRDVDLSPKPRSPWRLVEERDRFRRLGVMLHRRHE